MTAFYATRLDFAWNWIVFIKMVTLIINDIIIIMILLSYHPVAKPFSETSFETAIIYVYATRKPHIIVYNVCQNLT